MGWTIATEVHGRTLREIEPVSVLSNRVSSNKIRILEIRDQRLARKNCGSGQSTQIFPLQRPTDLALTSGNVVRLFSRRKQPTEATVAGWGARIRTWKSRSGECPLKRRRGFLRFASVWVMGYPRLVRTEDSEPRTCGSLGLKRP